MGFGKWGCGVCQIVDEVEKRRGKEKRLKR